MNGFGMTYKSEYIRMCLCLCPLFSACPYFFSLPPLITQILHSVHYVVFIFDTQFHIAQGSLRLPM